MLVVKIPHAYRGREKASLGLKPWEELSLSAVVVVSWESSPKALADPGLAVDCSVTCLFLAGMSLSPLLKHMLILEMCLSPVGFEGKLCLTALMASVLLLFSGILEGGHLVLPQTALCFWAEIATVTSGQTVRQLWSGSFVFCSHLVEQKYF